MIELHLKFVLHLWNAYVNDEHADNADNLDIIMPMYNLIETAIIIKTLQEVWKRGTKYEQ